MSLPETESVREVLRSLEVNGDTPLMVAYLESNVDELEEWKNDYYRLTYYPLTKDSIYRVFPQELAELKFKKEQLKFSDKEILSKIETIESRDTFIEDLKKSLEKALYYACVINQLTPEIENEFSGLIEFIKSKKWNIQVSKMDFVGLGDFVNILGPIKSISEKQINLYFDKLGGYQYDEAVCETFVRDILRGKKINCFFKNEYTDIPENSVNPWELGKSIDRGKFAEIFSDFIEKLHKYFAFSMAEPENNTSIEITQEEQSAIHKLLKDANYNFEKASLFICPNIASMPEKIWSIDEWGEFLNNLKLDKEKYQLVILPINASDDGYGIIDLKLEELFKEKFAVSNLRNIFERLKIEDIISLQKEGIFGESRIKGLNIRQFATLSKLLFNSNKNIGIFHDSGLAHIASASKQKGMIFTVNANEDTYMYKPRNGGRAFSLGQSIRNIKDEVNDYISSIN